MGRWQLQHAFEPTQLLQRLQAKQYGAARFAREFGLERLQSRRPSPGWWTTAGEAILKHVHASAANVDGRGLTPSTCSQLVGAGPRRRVEVRPQVQGRRRFPPAQLVEACLKREGELTVRIAACC